MDRAEREGLPAAAGAASILRVNFAKAFFTLLPPWLPKQCPLVHSGQRALSQHGVPGECSGFDFQFDFNTGSEPINDPNQAIHGETCQVGVADA